MSAQTRAVRGEEALAQVVDVFVGARRLAGWALWLQLAAVAHLVTRWASQPPIVDGVLPNWPDPDPRDGVADPRDGGEGEATGQDRPALTGRGLAERLWRVVSRLDVWGPLHTGDLAEEFVASEISAAAGISHYVSGQLVDAARTLFLTDRLPRTRRLLRAGLLDWTKLRTILTATQTLDDPVCVLVEARVIPDADLAAADAADAPGGLDPLADPARPGRALPEVARLTNPALQDALHAATAAIDAEAAARRAAKARAARRVCATPLADSMGRFEVTAGQDHVAAILTGLDHAVAAAKNTGDDRSPDQIRADHAVHLLTDGAHGTDAYANGTDAGQTGRRQSAGSTGSGADDVGQASGGVRTCQCGDGPDVEQRPDAPFTHRRAGGLEVRLTMPLSTWLELADDPAALDGYGALPAALARQIAADAVRDHPRTTTWRCVVVDDQHRTVLGVGDLVPTPRHDPTGRQRVFVGAAEPFCVFPGCRVPVRRCEIDHRRRYDHARPREGGPTCTCNLQPLCKRHHRLKTAGLITPAALPCGDPPIDVPADPADCMHADAPGCTHADAPGCTHADAGGGRRDDGRAGTLAGTSSDATAGPAGAITWTTWTGRTYLHQPPPATPAGAGRVVVAACAGLAKRDDGDGDGDGDGDHDGDHGDGTEGTGAGRADSADVVPGSSGAGTPTDEDPDWLLTHWDRARKHLRDRRSARREGAPYRSWTGPDDPTQPPPF